jgi:hypothetical protein
MSDGKALLAIGLGLDVLATLFISLDALRSQSQTTKIYEILAFITGFEVIDRRIQPAEDVADKLSKQARAAVQPDAPEEITALMAKLDELDEANIMLTVAARAADRNNREMLQGELETMADEFASRKYLVAAAIAAVFVGGVCEFIGGVVLGA